MRITFDKLNNTRDLGGMLAQDGRKIRPGMLIRSGQPGYASFRDLVKLRELCSLIVDFRTPSEASELADPDIDGVENVHLPVVEDLTAGVSREEESDETVFRKLAGDPAAAKAYMCRIYESLGTSELALKGYARFVRLLAEGRDKAVMWHCTAGKDRAGFATVIVLEILGVGRDTIMDDYLRTNEYVRENVESMIERFFGSIGGSNPDTEEALRCMFEARREYLESAYSSIAKQYGSFGRYLEEGLKLTGEDIDNIRSRYLE